jgi:hypothetical protein
MSYLRDVVAAVRLADKTPFAELAATVAEIEAEKVAELAERAAVQS